MDEEKWVYSPVASARSYVSLRKRRALATVGSVLALVVLGGWWTLGFPDMPYITNNSDSSECTPRLYDLPGSFPRRDPRRLSTTEPLHIQVYGQS